MREMPQWWRRTRAKLTGYFWKPCPLCGRMFGGYENGGHLWTQGTDHSRTGSVTCARCPGDHYAPGYDGYRTFDS